MLLPIRTAIPVFITAGLCPAQEWTEAAVVQRFLEQSPQVREVRARVALAEAQARGRAIYPNPVFSYSREGAGLTEFFQAEQALPITGRLKLLRQAGAIQVRVTEAEGAFSLWEARCRLRQAFYRLLAAQQREAVYAAGAKEMDEVVRVLRDRERQGEGSKYDRLRAERERSELLAELALARAAAALDHAQVRAFLPAETVLTTVSGELGTAVRDLDEKQLTSRALAIREDYRAGQQRLEQYRLETRAAERLRFPEPVLNAGIKRADLQGRIATGGVAGISLPLPLFNKGQTEVARYSAEQTHASARLDALAQQIRAVVEGYSSAFGIRVRAREAYSRELDSSGPDLVRIAMVGYQEGEIGILQLLDAYRAHRQSRLRVLDLDVSVKEAQIELELVVGEELEK